MQCQFQCIHQSNMDPSAYFSNPLNQYHIYSLNSIYRGFRKKGFHYFYYNELNFKIEFDSLAGGEEVAAANNFKIAKY